MDSDRLTEIYQSHPHIRSIQAWISSDSLGNLHVKNLTGSSISLFAAAVFELTERDHWFLCPDHESAAYLYNDLCHALPQNKINFFPSSFKRSVTHHDTDEPSLILRTAVLNRLNPAERKEGNIVVVTYPEAIMEKVITETSLQKNTLELKVNESISIPFVQEVLETYHFEEVEFVSEPGQFAVRGSLVDIFSFAHFLPYRIDFFGDEVESIRTFEVEDQLSRDRLQSIIIVPNIHLLVREEAGNSILRHISKETIFWSDDLPLSTQKIAHIFNHAPDRLVSKFTGNESEKHQILSTLEEIEDLLLKFNHIEWGKSYYYKAKETLIFSTLPQPLFKKNFELLSKSIAEYQEKGYTVFLLSENPKQIQRLKDIFKSLPQKVSFIPIDNILHEGFIDNDLKICLYTDHQIFERYHKYLINNQFIKSNAFTLNELRGLQIGDYIVHIDHGIGVFGGLGKIEVNGHQQESIRLIYKDNDILYVNIHNLHKISKYRGKDGQPPKIYKLGTPAWQNMKQSTKKKVKDIARDLIALYAKRKNAEGFAFSSDTYLQEELEASFIYEDTPDQIKATAAVKNNMEQPYPMDHLICGDVGFGKTEIAIRAAFKAVSDNKQVAILVPTTILALQHYNTFRERLEKFPCTVEHISRLKSTKEQKDTLLKIEKGEIDIIIGTHRLVSKDIIFKNLGLLIIDEEQKFGVAVKEKLKNLRINVDTLTMTATPIPRTLQFSLMGARDLSIINTPPPNRHPIQTEIHVFNEVLIREGIEQEVQRGGQVFFIYNRVDHLPKIEAYIQKVCPQVKTVIAHGQMDGEHLEQVMLGFIRGDFDVLICTTIIESGLDIPNANTIFVNEAQNFGLSDLHQLRGRVGRSNKKAYCYLLTPPYTSLTQEARLRLKAIEEFSDLGNGFQIAMQDLDIRGAGNLLGAEQSGFISEIGLETYQRILNEAMLELREEEFSGLFEESASQEKTETTNTTFVVDCVIDTDMELLFPDNYIRNVTERIRLYRELDNIESEEALSQFEQQLADRFGPLPEATYELLNVVRLRWLAKALGFEKVMLKNNKMMVWFVSNEKSSYYQSSIFEKIIRYVQKNDRHCSMKENKDKLSLNVEHIHSIQEAIASMKAILNFA